MISTKERLTRMGRFMSELESLFNNYGARASLYWDEEDDPGTILIRFEGTDDHIEICNPSFRRDYRFICPEQKDES